MPTKTTDFGMFTSFIIFCIFINIRKSLIFINVNQEVEHGDWHSSSFPRTVGLGSNPSLQNTSRNQLKIDCSCAPKGPQQTDKTSIQQIPERKRRKVWSKTTW